MAEDKLERMFGHLGNLTPDELRAHVRKNRADRRMIKAKPAAVKKAKKDTDSAKEKARKLIAKVGDLDLLERLLKEAGHG